MDDSKGSLKRRSRSLLWMLSVSICGAILVVGVIGAFVSFAFAFHEARDLQDDELREIAQLVKLGGQELLSSEGHPPSEDEPEMRIWVIRTHKAGTSVDTPDLSLTLPAGLPDGLHTVESKGESWRLYSKAVDGETGLAVAQRTAARDWIAGASALRTLIPFLVVIPILILLTAFLIRVLLRKVNEVASQLDKKGDADLEPLPLTGVPEEIVPFVAATNRLFERVEHILLKQRQFVADAAHELRSPLTAMTLHLENAIGSASTPDSVPARLAPLGAGLARMRALVEQLLTLARVEATTTLSCETFQGKGVVVEAIGELFPLADSKGVDLGLVVGEDAALGGSEQDFCAVVRNAIENAVRYTPSGGRVDVRFFRCQGRTVFEVEDDGPGIPAEQLTRVFDPFYRIPGSNQPGSGLGLAIARSAAARLRGTLTLENIHAEGRTGLRFVYQQALMEDQLTYRSQAEVS